MKRIILVSVLLAGSVAAVFAEWTKVVCAGGDGVFSRNRIEWEDDACKKRRFVFYVRF